MLKSILTLFFCLSVALFVNGQGLDTLIDHKKITSHFIQETNEKLTSLDKSIQKKTSKTLAALEKQEKHLLRKLQTKDSLLANTLLGENKDLYAELNKKISNPTTQALKEYIPQLDSLKTSIAFLNDPLTRVKGKMPAALQQKTQAANTTVERFKNRLQAAEEIKQQLKKHKEQLKQRLEKYGFARDLKKLNKNVYYFQQQLTEFKSLLKDRKKAEEKALLMLRKLPAFQSFMQKNSQLAAMFRLPDNYGTPQALAGLQTRSSIQNQIEQRFVGSGVNPQQYIGQQVQQAQGELNKLKDKINKAGGGSSDLEMPDFKPNTQKTKKFLQRIELGTNIQSQKANGLLPVTSDIALTAGYKLNDKSVTGIGAAYKLGWGNGWQHINFTSQGVGLRTYIDYKIKGNFWLTGGYEQNYQKAFRSIEELRIFDAWQTSGLIGITKKMKIGKKTNNVQLLWDFMSYKQVPRRQAIIYRIGFKL